MLLRFTGPPVPLTARMHSTPQILSHGGGAPPGGRGRRGRAASGGAAHGHARGQGGAPPGHARGGPLGPHGGHLLDVLQLQRVAPLPAGGARGAPRASGVRGGDPRRRGADGGRVHRERGGGRGRAADAGGGGGGEGGGEGHPRAGDSRQGHQQDDGKSQNRFESSKRKWDIIGRSYLPMGHPRAGDPRQGHQQDDDDGCESSTLDVNYPKQLSWREE
eukprot:435628-Prorocentrum_minimum.AAC.4